MIMNRQKLVFRVSKSILLAAVLFVALPSQAQAQGQKPRPKLVKKEVVRPKPAQRYSHLPKRGAVVTTMPSGAKVVSYRNTPYHVHNGIFYRPSGRQFVVVAPPVGVRVSSLPVGNRLIVLRGRQYFYYYGTFYTTVGREYKVVQPPVGALVEAIPDGYQELVIDGNTYYVVDDVQYKAVIHNDEIWYEVIKVG